MNYLIRVDLALEINLLDDAYNLSLNSNNVEKIRKVSFECLKKGRIDISIKCMELLNDFAGLYLIYTSLGMKE